MAALVAQTIIIPSPYLASYHQTKNAEVYADSGAAIVMSEDKLDQEPYILADEVIRLLDDKTKRQKLSANIKKFAKTDATEAMAEIIIKAGDDKKK
jgi:UDP-N-acetylglucosamine--N-acetylmuramyl-(pentapeptide) pyrophosphoryl-undecaprenol N-acetylglucosamine transferase